MNLVSNAAKFTSTGGQMLVMDEADAEQVVVHMRDIGRGNPIELLHCVFDPFVVTSGSNHNGLRFGIATVKSFVKSNGEAVAAASDNPSTVVEFTVRLPRDPLSEGS